MTRDIITWQPGVRTKLDAVDREFSEKISNAFAHQIGAVLQDLPCPRAEFFADFGGTLI